MQFTGITVELSKKIDVRQLAGMDFTRNWNTYFHQAFRGKHLKVEEEVKGENGSEYFEIILNPMHNDNKEIFGVGCFARDITERKKTENQIREQISRLKEVAWIQSHELRKPVANILGLLSLLKATPPNADNNELLEHMDTSCHELDAIVKKIVDKTSTPEERSSL
jgi:PAS domain S-box-containing protein